MVILARFFKPGKMAAGKMGESLFSISLTTLFHPFLTLLDSAVKTDDTLVRYNHSQVSRTSISRDANSLCECVEIQRERPVFSALVSSFTRRGDDRKQRHLRISHSIVQSAAGFIPIKGGGKFFLCWVVNG